MLYVLTSIGFFLWVIRTTLFWTSLWQVKEYRWDRLSVHLRETAQGKSLLFSPFAISNTVVLVLYIGIIFNDSLTQWYQLLVFVYFSILGLLFIRRIITTKFKRPAVTIKSFAICSLTIVLMSIGYIYNLIDQYLWVVILNLFTPFVVAIFVYAFSFPTELYKDYLVEKARKKIVGHEDLLVIGVSGSYGKTSTKEYVANILSKKFEVVKTPLSNNTPIAIAQTILKYVNSHTEILIVEIGSYKKGEVEEICDIVHPKISITTAIGEQHVSLYGSLRNILQTEKELIDSLPKDGISLFNANSDYIEKLYTSTKKKVILYATEDKSYKKNISVFGSHITAEKNGISFIVTVGKNTLKIHTSLLGRHNVENILPAIYLGLHLGMTPAEIIKAVQKLVPLPKTMKKFTTQDGVILIDDSFNASPESVLAAADYLRVYNHKKIFVLMPLIELGEKAAQYHKEIGKALSKCDYLFLTNKNFVKEIKQGILEGKGTCIVSVEKQEKIADKISEITKNGDVVIFEGKETGNVLTRLL